MFQILKQDTKSGKIEKVVSINFISYEAAEIYMINNLIPEGKPFYLYPYFVGSLQADGSSRV